MFKLLRRRVEELIFACFDPCSANYLPGCIWWIRRGAMIVPLTDAQLKAIRNSCPRSQAEIDQDLAIVRHWLNKQPHLPKPSECDFYYLKYIHNMITIYIFRHRFRIS